MCGRYYIDAKILEKIRRVIRETERDTLWSSPVFREGSRGRTDICPGMPAPLVGCGSVDRQEVPVLTDAVWGLVPPSGHGLVINARAETVWDRPMFRRGIRRGRVAVPAAGFYEWNPEKEKFEFHRENGEPLFLAGFADTAGDERRFVILTTNANDSVSPVHPRMPVILKQDTLVPWLTDQGAAERILREVPEKLEKGSDYEQLSFL